MRINDLPQQESPTEVLTQAAWMDRLLQRRPGALLDGQAAHAELRTRIAALPGERAAAEELVRRRYAWRGYHLALPQERDCAGPRPGGHWITLLAEKGGELLGTLTVGPDTAQGLLAEETYREEIVQLRRDGHRLAELTKLAIEHGTDWKAALDALVQATWLIACVVHDLTDVLIEVNPRHVSFYQRVFGFEQLGVGRVCKRVGAPSVLLTLSADDFGARLQRAGIGG